MGLFKVSTPSQPQVINYIEYKKYQTGVDDFGDVYIYFRDEEALNQGAEFLRKIPGFDELGGFRSIWIQEHQMRITFYNQKEDPHQRTDLAVQMLSKYLFRNLMAINAV